jgi:YfiH family protein
MSFDHILWKDSARVKGVFSLKNATYHSEKTIHGLNLGYNTPETPEVASQNRKKWLEFAGVDPEMTATALQVHGNSVEVVTKGGIFPETDGFVSSTPGMSLGILVADCGGVLLADEKNGVIGACHAGWKGAVARIVEITIQKMKDLGAEIEQIEAFISPCISREQFEVGEEVAEHFPEFCIDRNFPKPHVDLKAFIKHSLEESGVLENQITVSDGCTVRDATEHYSYRREADKSGRMMALITLKK